MASHSLTVPDAVSRPPVESSSGRRDAPSFAVETQAGPGWTVGDGSPEFTIRIADPASWQRLSASGLYDVAKAFIDGVFEVDGDVVAAVRWWRLHASPAGAWSTSLVSHLRFESWFQTRHRARRNIEFHYDRSNQFYQQFLDQRLIYSSAYFASTSTTLDEAQLAKLDYIVRKLELWPEQRFLDVGCGWGALVMHAAQQRGNAQALGCTLSAQQYDYASRAIRAAGLADRATVEHRDYRTLEGQFDRVASIGMYEHVGRHRLAQYFTKLARLMAPNGLLLNSGIARPETVHDDAATRFLRRFVFPGGEVPYLAQIIDAAERAGLEVVDVENLRQHYALTCAHWVRRLQAHRDTCVPLVGGRTFRTWLLYLAGSVVSFERAESELYQILFAKRHEGMPHRLTRRYMYA